MRSTIWCALLAVICLAVPATAGATSISIGEPSGAAPPSGSTPGFQAEIVRGRVTAPAEDCSYGIQAQYGTSDDGTWVRDLTDNNWGTPPVYANGMNESGGSGTRDFEVTLSELRPNTIYHYRFVDSGTSCPDGSGGTVDYPPQKTGDVCFRANAGAVDCPPAGQSPPAPFVDMRAASDVTGTSATLHAVVDANGCSVVQDTRFQWGAAENDTYNPAENDPGFLVPPRFGTTEDAEPSGPFYGHTIHPVSHAITGLNPGWLYHVRVGTYKSCYDSDGHTPGSGIEISSERCLLAGSGPAPCHPASTAETTDPEGTGSDSSRKLTGVVHQHGCAAFWHFNTGPHGEASNATPGGSLAAGSGDVPVSEIVSGLASGSTYDVELRVRDALDCDVGTEVGGGVRQFSTASPPPPADGGGGGNGGGADGGGGGDQGGQRHTLALTGEQGKIFRDASPTYVAECEVSNLASYDASVCAAYNGQTPSACAEGQPSFDKAECARINTQVAKIRNTFESKAADMAAKAMAGAFQTAFRRKSSGGGEYTIRDATNTVAATGDSAILGYADGVVSVGAGNFLSVFAGDLIPKGTSGVVSVGAGGLVSVAAGNLIPKGTSSVVSVGAGNFSLSRLGEVVSVGAGNVFPRGTSNVVSVGAGNLISILQGSVVSVGAGNFNPLDLSLATEFLNGGGVQGLTVTSRDGNVVSVGAGNKVVAARQKRKRVVIAVGRVSSKTGGPATMRLKFTKKGRNAIVALRKKKHGRPRKLKFALTSTFKPPQGKRITAHRAVTVKP